MTTSSSNSQQVRSTAELMLRTNLRTIARLSLKLYGPGLSYVRGKENARHVVKAVRLGETVWMVDGDSELDAMIAAVELLERMKQRF